MESSLESTIPTDRPRSLSLRAYAVSAVGPATAAGGVIWAIVQPYRLTILHPRGQGLWWLIAEGPLLAILAGLLFSYFVARPLVADLEAARAAPR